MLKIKNLSAGIEGNKILNNINLDINSGELHVIMGTNGTGKSTLGNILSGKENYQIHNGDIIYKGESIIDLAPEERAYRGIFMSFQYPVAIPGVNTMHFIRTAVNSIRKAQNKDEIEPAEFIKVFKEKSLADIFEDIYNNSSENKKQLDVLIREVVQFIKDGDTAVQLIPAIKEYLDIKVKNDEQLVKMAAIVQRLVVGEQKGSSEFEFGLSDKEKEDLLKSLDPVAKDLQKYTDEINSKIEPEPTKIVES